MSCNVNYKGSQIASVGANQTKTLLTAGKYCEDDFTLVDTSNPVAEENDVIFIDYDGTIRYSYSAEDFLALTDLPPNPTHAGLVPEGWNWTLAEAKDYVSKYGMHVIGQTYDTSDGAAWLYLYISSDTVNVPVTVAFRTNGSSVVVDWGDGSNQESFTSTWTQYLPEHQYSSPGPYIIKIKAGAIQGCNLGYPSIIAYNVMGLRENFANTDRLFRINVGSTCVASYAFCNYLRFLKEFSLSKRSYFTGNYIFYNAPYPIKAIVIPPGARALYQFASLSRLEKISFSPSQGNIEIDSFLSTMIEKAFIPDGATIIRSQAFGGAYLQYIIIPDTVTTIEPAVFNSSNRAKFLRFASITPPSLAASTVFSGLSADCKIYVPFSALASYLSGTNYPAPATYTYIGFATYTSGATLPTQDSTQAYNVVWYASKADAIAQTNAISTGNGKEIYCRYTAA